MSNKRHINEGPKSTITFALVNKLVGFVGISAYKSIGNENGKQCFCIKLNAFLPIRLFNVLYKSTSTFHRYLFFLTTNNFLEIYHANFFLQSASFTSPKICFPNINHFRYMVIYSILAPTGSSFTSANFNILFLEIP